MRNRARLALKYTHFTPESHPALCALIDYAAQRPGLDFRNYGSLESYRTEVASITRQWRKILVLLDVAEYYAVTDAQVIEASQWAFSGRMTWTDAGWNYCTGQYWPTEYRAAVVAVLRYALPAHEGRNI